MADTFYPTVDLDFIKEHVSGSDKIEDGGIIKFGSTTMLVLRGTQAIYKRSISVRELQPGQICLEQATTVALKFGFLGQLLGWLEENRDWKEGAYVVTGKGNEGEL